MELTYSLVRLLALLSVVHASVMHLKETEAADEVTESIGEEQRKIHQECRNPDYKKYIMCLMRPKRHHHSHADTPMYNDSVHCLEECLKKCSVNMHDCDQKCGHCTKRTKHRHQIVTEYEVNCESGNCYSSDDDLRTTNITTNIDINNIINTHPNNGKIFVPGNGSKSKPTTKPGENGDCVNGTSTSTCTRSSTSSTSTDTETDIDNVTKETDTRIVVPSIPLVPQISMVPQITYGINLAGGCAFSTWLCIQQGATRKVQPSSVQPDCSVCGNPLLHHKCNVTFCYTATSVGTACKSPACVDDST